MFRFEESSLVGNGDLAPAGAVVARPYQGSRLLLTNIREAFQPLCLTVASADRIASKVGLFMDRGLNINALCLMTW